MPDYFIRPSSQYYVRRCGLLLPTSSVVGRSVCRCVGLSVTLDSLVKTAEAINMPFGLRTRVGQRNDALDGVHIAERKAAVPLSRGSRVLV